MLKNDDRASLKISKKNTRWLRKLSRDSAMGLTMAQLAETALERSRNWLETNTPRKARP
jgi:hypothetical protein